MKAPVHLLLLIFITFLVTPTIVSLIKKDSDTSLFYSFSEEEHSHKEVKAVCNLNIEIVNKDLSEINSSLIHFENLSKHDKISSKIIIPPPDLV